VKDSSTSEGTPQLMLEAEITEKTASDHKEGRGVAACGVERPVGEHLSFAWGV